MRNVIGVMAIIIAWVGTPAIAADPPAPQPSSGAQTAAGTQPASTTEGSPASATTAIAPVRGTGTQVKLVAGDDAAAAQMKKFKAAGYKPEVRNGEVVYCRKEQQMGSRFEVKHCGTAQQLDEQMRNSQDATERAQRTLTQRLPGS